MLNILPNENACMKFANSPASFQTHQDLWEYLLVAYPDAELNEKITGEKKLFCKAHHYALSTDTKPCITLAGFLLKEPMEEIIIKWIQNICRLHGCFGVTLNNFSGFPPHTIYLRVQDPQPFEKLAHSLKIIDRFIQSNDCPPLHQASKPHLTLASGLPELIYTKSIREYAQKSFHGSFIVDKLVLLKRDASAKCRLVNTFGLAAAPAYFN